MKKFVLLPFLFICFKSFCQFPAESDPHRGLYVDRFAKKLQGANVYDPNFSILAVDANHDGIFEKEDALLIYCAKNHITDIELYDLEKILGGSLTAWNENTKMYETLEKHLCRFMQKARNQYCITEIGGAGGAAYVFDSVAAFNERYPITEPYRLRNDQRGSVYFDSTLNVVERSFPETDADYKKSELLKYALRTADFNSCNPCGAHFDNMNIELEFWFSCATDLPGFQSLLFAMNSIKQMYNSNHPDQPLKTEAYLAFLTYCPNYIDVINFMDGCNNCAPCSACTNPHPRLLDRVLYSQLTGNGAYFDYSIQNLFEQPQTGDSSDYHSIQYAESINTGGSVEYLGGWFELSPWYNIFSAEEFYYDGYRNNPGATFWSPESNNVQPGGTTWFAASHLVTHQDHPEIIQNSGPYCGPDSALVTFYYVGPDDPGMDYIFWVTNDANGDTVYPRGGGMINNTSTPYIPSTSILPRHRSIDFTDTLIFPVLYLPGGSYTSHINLYYDHHAGCSYSSDYPIHVNSHPVIDLAGDSVFCHGEFTFLKVNYGSAFQWYRDSLPIIAETTQFLHAAEDGNYFCYVSGGGMCSGYSDTIHIHVLPLPSVFVNAYCNGNGTITLKSNSDNPNPASTNLHGDGGLLYLWNTGAVTDQLTITPGASRTSYRLTVTDPYSGCSRYRDISVPSAPLNSYTPSVFVSAVPSSPCSHDGILRAGILPDPGGTVSFLWSTGETTRNLYGLAPGQYSVTETVWGGACSYYASINLGTLPADSPLVSAVITNVSCHNTNDGAIQLTLTGGHPPFYFKWRDIPDDTIHDPNSKNQFNLYAGTYYVTILDSAGCEFTKSFYVASSNGNVTLSPGTINPVTLCAGYHSGSGSVNVAGGNSPYSYQWNDSAMQTG
ncbi:MAG: SprB repeat-containing protein, partial [Bacteroidota bacterium]